MFVAKCANKSPRGNDQFDSFKGCNFPTFQPLECYLCLHHRRDQWPHTELPQHREDVQQDSGPAGSLSRHCRHCSPPLRHTPSQRGYTDQWRRWTPTKYFYLFNLIISGHLFQKRSLNTNLVLGLLQTEDSVWRFVSVIFYYLRQAGGAADLLVTPVLTVRVTVTDPAEGNTRTCNISLHYSPPSVIHGTKLRFTPNCLLKWSDKLVRISRPETF